MNKAMGWLGLGLLAVASGCGSDVTPADVNTRTTAMVQGNVVASTKALSTLTSGTTYQALNGAVTQLGTAFSSLTGSLTPTTVLARPRIKAVVTGPDLCLTTPNDPACLPDPTTPEERAQRLADFLEQSVFTPENLESSDGSSAVFRLPGAVVCKSAECSQSCVGTTCAPKVCVDTTPADCVTKVDEMQLRLRATPQDPDGIRIDLLVGPDRANPVSVEGSPTKIAGELDFGGLKAATAYIAGVLGTTPTDLPTRFAGRIRAQLQTAGDQDVTLTVSILTAIGVDIPVTVDGASAGAMTFDVARADPAFMLHANGVTKNVTFELSLGSLDTSYPVGTLLADLGAPASLVGKTHYAGLTARASITEGDPVVKVTNLGIGPGAMTMSVGGVVMISYDLNPTLGRAFDLTITPATATEGATFAVSPGFDLSLLWNYQVLAPYLPSGSVPSWMMDDTVRLQLIGEAGGSVQPVAANATTGFAGGLKVLTGTLLVSSRVDATTVTVPAGQCLVSKVPATGTNLVVGSITAAPCP